MTRTRKHTFYAAVSYLVEEVEQLRPDHSTGSSLVHVYLGLLFSFLLVSIAKMFS